MTCRHVDAGGGAAGASVAAGSVPRVSGRVPGAVLRGRGSPLGGQLLLGAVARHRGQQPPPHALQEGRASLGRLRAAADGGDGRQGRAGGGARPRGVGARRRRQRPPERGRVPGGGRQTHRKGRPRSRVSKRK